MGIASFSIAVSAVLTFLPWFVFDPSLLPPAVFTLLESGSIIGVSASFIGLGFGIAGVVQRRRKRLFAVLGPSSNGLVVLGDIALIVLSFAMGVGV